MAIPRSRVTFDGSSGMGTTGGLLGGVTHVTQTQRDWERLQRQYARQELAARDHARNLRVEVAGSGSGTVTLETTDGTAYSERKERTIREKLQDDLNSWLSGVL